MNIDQIRELAQIVRENHLESIELQCDDMVVKIKMPANDCSNMPTQQKIIDSISETDESVPEKIHNCSHEVTSPMVGVFYSASSPKKHAFVSVGSKVKKGDVICIIEAMKLMNEIAADKDGEIVEICVENGQVVEYGQVIFRMI